MNDPCGDSHHDNTDALEEPEHGLAVLPAHCDSNPSDNRKDDQSEDVSAVRPSRFEHPGIFVLRVNGGSGGFVFILE